MHLHTPASLVRELAASAKRHIEAKLRDLDCAPAQAAVVFDIDDTAIETCGEKTLALPLGLALYHVAEELGLRIFFVTARNDDESGGHASFTLDQLRRAGFHHVTDLCLCPESVPITLHDIAAFKARVRSELMRDWDVQHLLLCVGDQWSDHFALRQDQLLHMYFQHDSRKCYKTVSGSVLHIKMPHRERIES